VQCVVSADNAVSEVNMIRHVIYGVLVGRFLMKFAERFTMSFNGVHNEIKPKALIMNYGNETIWCAVVRNRYVAERVIGYLCRNNPNIAPNFYVDDTIFDNSRSEIYKSYVKQFQSGDIHNIRIFAPRVPRIAYYPLQTAMFSLHSIKATH